MPAMSQKEKNPYSRLYRLIRNKECSNVKRAVSLCLHHFSVLTSSTSYPWMLCIRTCGWNTWCTGNFSVLSGGSKINHCCVTRISVRCIWADTWNANIASYRKITLLLDCLYLVSKSMLLCSAYLHDPEKLKLWRFLFEGKNQTEDKQPPETWFACYKLEEFR